ncbi:acetyltransferase [Candidatus Symbiobacter mobilis CR]|uniref:Acetyltransferase n=2 Tax=Candidatus Symbiobacter TaxID=1436289 RepID=U5N816_9BURK|nr:acetyltransferase [Candidatus Symbiobacter mobilis CR]
MQNTHVNEKVVIESDVWIGFGAILLTKVTIGKGSVVAAGSVVTCDVPPYSIAAGVPARVIGRRFEDDTSIVLHELAIKNGKFTFSERGYDYCVIQPALLNQ